jgi:hypothetical protein
MSLRCNCPNGRDEIVFGPVHKCRDDTKQTEDAPVYHRPHEWGAGYRVALRVLACATSLTQDDFTLSPPERPWETTLGPDDMT